MRLTADDLREYIYLPDDTPDFTADRSVVDRCGDECAEVCARAMIQAGICRVYGYSESVERLLKYGEVGSFLVGAGEEEKEILFVAALALLQS